MKSTIVVFGSSTGTCENIANTIAEKLGVEAINVTDFSADTIANHDNLILGTSGKTVAIFGCGDSESYSDTFCAAMKEIYDAAEGANIIGSISTDGYTFDDSDAVVDGKFIGLPLDDVNEDDKTEGRIDAWLDSIKGSL